MAEFGKMRKYELVFILAPNLKAEEQKKEIAKVEKAIESLKGKLEKKEIWGKKELAYPIRKFKEGIYVKFDLRLPEKKIRDWRGKIKRENKIIRHLLIKRKS